MRSPDDISPDEEFSVEADDDWLALLDFLGDVANDLLQAASLDEVASVLDRTVDRIIEIEYPVLYLYNEDREILEQVWSKGFTDEERRVAEKSALERHPGWVYRNAEGFYVPDVENDPEDRTEDTPRQIEVRSRLYHPVVTEDECVGAFGFGAGETDAFDREHIAALGFYSSLIGATYGRLHRERKLRETRHQLERTNETLRAIREVSQLMVRERDPDRILQEICDLLVATETYESVFIVEPGDDSGPAIRSASAVSDAEETIERAVEREPLRGRIDALLAGDSTFFRHVSDSSEPELSGSRLVGSALEYAGIVHGALILGSAYSEAGIKERTLLEEVASDVAFVLHMHGLDSEASRLVERALRDWLTDLPNRALFRNRLDQSIARAERNDDSFTLLLIDLDNLKEVNDSLGHAAGDRLLVRVGRRLERVVRDYDTVARIGGDEFTVILEDVVDRSEVDSAVERLQNQLDGPIDIYGETFHSSASIGIVRYHRLKEMLDTDRLDGTDLLRAADHAMYRAKERPGTTWNLPETADLRRTDQPRQTNRLRRALEEDAILPHYQPLLEVETERIAGLEALARWRRDGGVVENAGAFLEAAERMGKLWEVSKRVYRNALEDFENWRTLDDELELYLNLSPSSFEATELFELVGDTAVEPGEVVLEITEQDLLRNPERIEGILDRGFRVAIDDFGTGYSSFEYLKRFDVDSLKVDMSFVQGAPHDETDRAILDSICRLGSDLGLQVVGEGVETNRQWDCLAEYPCDLAQGFLLGRPADAESIGRRLAKSNGEDDPVSE